MAQEKGFNVTSGFFPNAVETPFDIITMFQVLEHTSVPHTILEKTKQILKPHGHLILGVPDSEGPVKKF